jgi:hypothetical protein
MGGGLERSTPGGCPILNAESDVDDGNQVLRARAPKVLRSWLIRLQRNHEALRRVQSHLHQYLDNQVAASR